MSTRSGSERPQDDQPTTEEALPNVDLTTDPKTERISEETLGPDAVDDGDGADKEPKSEEASERHDS